MCICFPFNCSFVYSLNEQLAQLLWCLSTSAGLHGPCDKATFVSALSDTRISTGSYFSPTGVIKGQQGC